MKNKFINSKRAKKFAIVGALVFVFAPIFNAETNAQARKKTISKAAKKKSAPKAKTTATNKTNEKTKQLLPTLPTPSPALSTLPKVTQIDALALKNLIERGGGANPKPLLVNFWATWCDPCREEFPQLVKIDGDYKDKIDFVVVSVDDLAEIKRGVPEFLNEMKATMPAYLLKTPDETAAISAVAKDWKGGYPFTILYDAAGAAVFTHQGKVDDEKLRGAIDKILTAQIIK